MKPAQVQLLQGARCQAPRCLHVPVRPAARSVRLCSHSARPSVARTAWGRGCGFHRVLAPPRPAFGSIDPSSNGSTSPMASLPRSTASRDEEGMPLPPPPQQHWRQQQTQRLDRQQLLGIGHAFVECWFGGIQRGSASVEAEMRSILAPQVVLSADGVRQPTDIEGLPALLEELERSHQEYYQSEHKPILFGASEGGAEQCVYALVEGRYQDVGGLPGHPATFRISHCHHILALHVGPSGKVARVDLRRQLTEEDKDELLTDPMHCYPSPFPKQSLVSLPEGMHGDNVQHMRRAVERFWSAWATAPEATRHSRPASPDPHLQQPHKGSLDSPAASTSSIDSANATPAQRQQHRQEQQQQQERACAELESDVLAPDYRLTDAYGIWPTLRAPGAAAPSQRFLDKKATLRTLALLQQHYSVKMKVLDVAPADGDALACFTHWQARLTRRRSSTKAARGNTVNNNSGITSSSASSSGGASSTNGGSMSNGSVDADSAAAATALAAAGVALGGSRARSRSFLLEGFEVDLFDDSMKLQSSWLFKGPLDIEARLLLAAQRQAQEAEAAEAERALRRQRRQQREQQLTELLAWMQRYQEQWDRQVAHVQSAIERQRQRLVEVGGKVGGGSRDGGVDVNGVVAAASGGVSGGEDGGDAAAVVAATSAAAAAAAAEAESASEAPGQPER